MNEQLRESISALIDGEATELELRRIVHETESLNDIMHTWRRFHNYRSIMNNETSVFSGIDISKKVSAALEKEQKNNAVMDCSEVLTDTSIASADRHHKQDISVQQSHWVRTLSRISIAASVAVLTVLGVKNVQQLNDAENIGVGIVAANDNFQINLNTQIQNQPVRVDPAAQKRLGEYVKAYASKDAYKLRADDFEAHMANYKAEETD